MLIKASCNVNWEIFLLGNIRKVTGSIVLIRNVNLTYRIPKITQLIIVLLDNVRTIEGANYRSDEALKERVSPIHLK